MLTVLVGLGCMASVFWGRVGTGDSSAQPNPMSGRVPNGAAGLRSAAIPMPVAAASGTTEAGIDRTITTGAIGHDSALRKPNPLAYADGKNGGPPTLTGVEAVNYLAGNTIKREEPGKPARFTYFASRGVQGDGNERSFVASAWDRNRPDLCEVAADGTPTCRPLTITLDGQYEFPGAKLGSRVDRGRSRDPVERAMSPSSPITCRFLERASDSAQATAAKAGSAGAPALWAGFVGRLVSVQKRRRIRRRPAHPLLRRGQSRSRRPLDTGGCRAPGCGFGYGRPLARVQDRHLPDANDRRRAQSCFKPEASGLDSVRLVPIGKGGKPQRVTVLTAASAPQTAGK